MDISKEINLLVNEQIGHELFNRHLYYQIASYFETRNLDGFAKFFKSQAGEDGETLHAEKFRKYITDRNGIVEIPSIDAPSLEFSNITQVMELYKNQEYDTTQNLYKIFSKARELNDYTTELFLKWFLDEQIEEENLANYMLNRATLINENPVGIMQWDFELNR